jgi:alkylation response protein AidB-like acyl-CoA dehydrogenase
MKPLDSGPAAGDLLAEFRGSVRDVLRRASASRGSQPVWSPEAADASIAKWAASLGWTGLLVGERWGGGAAGMAEVAVVAEELGGHLTPLPFLSSAVLAASALSVGGSQEQQQRWLPGLASGQLRGAAALTGPTGRTGAGFVDVRAVEEGDGVRLSGAAGLVLDGAGADFLVVAARRVGASPELFVVDGGSPGVEITDLLSVDRTRQLAGIAFRDVYVPASALLPRGAEATAAMADRGSVAVAADALGAARRALDLAVSYAKQREQFGRPIGAFQAIKHKLADMYLLVQGAALAVQGAAEALDEQRDADRLVAVAASYARDAAVQVTGDAIQVHGGIGYTWEHDSQRLFKRAKFDQALLGDPWAYRERLAGLVLGQAGTG